MGEDILRSDVVDLLESKGISRRDFLSLCAMVAGAAGLTQLCVPRVAQALEKSVIGAAHGNLYPVLWLEGGSCTGCTESFIQLADPAIESIILEMISLNYCDLISAGAGSSLERAKEQTIAAGNYLLVYEGSVQKGQGGNVMRVAQMTGPEIAREASKGANAVIAVGSCAVNGGWCAAYPNPTQAIGIEAFLKEEGIDTPVVNIPGCPVNPDWLMTVLAQVVMMEDPALALEDRNRFNQPNAFFNQKIHDNCERRGHFDMGEFVYEFGSREEELGYCLYAMGCKGPDTLALCGVTQYNNRSSWCIHSGAPCIGCCHADPMRPDTNWVDTSSPFTGRFRKVRIGDANFELEPVLGIATGVVALGLVAYGFGMKAKGRLHDKGEFEPIRAWDKKHPDKSVGVYANPVEGGPMWDGQLTAKNIDPKDYGD